MTPAGPAGDAQEKTPNRYVLRAVLVVVGVLLLALALAAALIPIRRLDSISRTNGVAATPTQSPPVKRGATRGETPTPVATPAATAGPAPAIQREVRTEKSLPDSLIATLLVVAATFIGAGVFLPNIDELSIGALKVPIGRAAADATLDKARTEGVVTGDVVPVDKVDELLQQSAVTAFNIERTLRGAGGRRIAARRASSPAIPQHGEISPRLLGGIAKKAADEAARDIEESP